MTRRLTSRTPITRVYREEINPDIAATTDASTKAQRVSLANSRIVVSERVDSLAVEEPLQIRVDGTDFLTTMRTPGNDFELVHGLLHAEASSDGHPILRQFDTVAGQSAMTASTRITPLMWL